MRSLEDLLPLLRSRSEGGSMNWEPSGTGFNLWFSQHEFLVWEWIDKNDDTTGVTLQLKNVEGQVIDSIVASEYSSHHEVVRNIFNAARRTAFKVDDVISDLQSALAKP